MAAKPTADDLLMNALLKRYFHRLHDDKRGAMSVLVLLIIWCLVAMIGLMWNTAEYARRRQHVQAAADSAAHSSAMWVARSLNAVTGQNMMVCQDASTEALWRACIQTVGDPNVAPYPNSGTFYTQLMKEWTDASNHVSNINSIQQKLQNLLLHADIDYQRAAAALDGVAANAGSDKDTLTRVRQARRVLSWIDTTYVHGGASSIPGYRPPGPNGEGLEQLINAWHVDAATQVQIFNLIMNYIMTVEMPPVRAFQNQVKPGTSRHADEEMQAHEETVHSQQLNVRDAVVEAIDQQAHRTPRNRPASSTSTEEFFNVNVTLAATKQQSDEPTVKDEPANQNSAAARPLGLAASGTASAPIMTPGEVDPTPGQGHTDTIRAMFPAEAAAQGLPTTFDIDPISPHTPKHKSVGENGQIHDWEDARIWYPDQPIPWNGALYTVRCNIKDGWGHIWLAPIERYFIQRLNDDEQNLRHDYVDPLDKLRYTETDTGELAHQIWKLQNLPLTPTVAPLPGSLPDDVKNDQGAFDQIPVVPHFKIPPNAPVALRSAALQYDVAVGAYTNDIGWILYYLDLYKSAFAEYYVPEMWALWDSAINYGHYVVMGVLPAPNQADPTGLMQRGPFMMLSTYQLRLIPEWARTDMESTAYTFIYNQIINMNIYNMIQNRTQTQSAMDALDRVAGPAAHAIAHEWATRPWPYEVAPPKTHTPRREDRDERNRPQKSPAGLTREDRQKFFSVVAWAQDPTPAKPFLPYIVGTRPAMSAYAQAEAFNWNEFNASWGGNDQFDIPTRTVYGMYSIQFAMIGCPRAWRLCSPGGWNWQPRLSIADNLSNAVKLNPELQDKLQQAGLNADNPDFDTINLH